jgi:hypothetical protein
MSEVTGLQGTLAGLDSIQRQILAQTKENLRSIGKEILADADAQVPIDTGELRESGYVRIVGHTCFVGYTAPHAARIHESIELQHPRGKAKFLEDPLRAEVPRFGEDLSKGVNP